MFVRARALDGMPGENAMVMLFFCLRFKGAAVNKSGCFDAKKGSPLQSEATKTVWCFFVCSVCFEFFF